MNQYADGRYTYMLSEEDVLHRQQRNIQPLAAVNLLDFSRHTIPLQKVLASADANIIVLDFWASWCVPCAADYPFLKKAEDALKNKSIRFISISIDVEEDTGKWVNRTRQQNTFGKPGQYRLENPKQSPVNGFFKLQSIPRYIVLDKTGNILEEDFDRPKEAAFQRKLEMYVSRYQQ
ncbi:TlpA family protein disulfide reductase [Deminuibacter soli]|uniref:Thioredoxin domain-containing protein n=1 Tax=Deminuibacter soli TaxID=2291815 RepID=A0A3E1NKR6_9BACT|nr:TlpA disulfide reductase family protein [Deminuibacter soli]RFM28530.1 hypothetical protein DXN05_06910 [Deminuibacter soli]